MIVSFDVPTILGGTLFEPSDLVDISSAVPTAYFDASAATPPIPVSSNVTGANFRAGLLVLTFDVPTTLGAATYMPGQLVSWNGSGFALYHSDVAWSAGRVNGLSLLPSPGNVSNLSLDISAATGDLILSWDASCSVGGEDYAIFEGTLGDWSSHTAIDCTDNGGDTRRDRAAAGGQPVLPGRAAQRGLLRLVRPEQLARGETRGSGRLRPSAGPDDNLPSIRRRGDHR